MQIESLSPQLVGLLSDIFQLGSEHEVPAQTVAVVRLLQRLRPDLVVLAQVQAWHLIEMGDLGTAREMLEDADAAARPDPMTKAMLVMCLYLQKDCTWQSYADMVRCMPANDDALQMLQSIEDSIAKLEAERRQRRYA